jgi:hypothetical protein
LHRANHHNIAIQAFIYAQEIAFLALLSYIASNQKLTLY